MFKHLDKLKGVYIEHSRTVSLPLNNMLFRLHYHTPHNYFQIWCIDEQVPQDVLKEKDKPAGNMYSVTSLIKIYMGVCAHKLGDNERKYHKMLLKTTYIFSPPIRCI